MPCRLCSKKDRCFVGSQRDLEFVFGYSGICKGSYYWSARYLFTALIHSFVLALHIFLTHTTLHAPPLLPLALKIQGILKESCDRTIAIKGKERDTYGIEPTLVAPPLQTTNIHSKGDAVITLRLLDMICKSSQSQTRPCFRIGSRPR